MARYMQKIGTPHIYLWTPQLEKKPGFKEIPDPFVKEEPVIETKKAEESAVEDAGTGVVAAGKGEEIVKTKKENGRATKQTWAVRRGMRGEK